MKTLAKISRGYLAGFIAGDGCIHVNKKGLTRIVIYQKDPKILYMIKNSLDCGGNVNSCMHRTPYGTGLMYRFEVARQTDVVKILQEVSPYMSFEKLSLGFIAGLVDSDGCFDRQKGRKHFRLRIFQKERGRLEKIQERFGGRVHPLNPRSKYSHWCMGDLDFIRKLNSYLILKKRDNL